MQHDRILHQAAFAFFWHPLHFSLRYAPQPPQYKPQYATISTLATTLRMIVSFFWFFGTMNAYGV
jgi:hypothetical protein